MTAVIFRRKVKLSHVVDHDTRPTGASATKLLVKFFFEAPLCRCNFITALSNQYRHGDKIAAAIFNDLDYDLIEKLKSHPKVSQCLRRILLLASKEAPSATIF